jgi:hypothetical protein
LDHLPVRVQRRTITTAEQAALEKKYGEGSLCSGMTAGTSMGGLEDLKKGKE